MTNVTILKIEASPNIEATLIEIEGKILSTRKLKTGRIIPSFTFNMMSLIKQLSYEESHPLYTELYFIDKNKFFNFYKKAGYFKDEKKITKYEGKDKKGYDIHTFPIVKNEIIERTCNYFAFTQDFLKKITLEHKTELKQLFGSPPAALQI